jgi:hypothetical protein
MKIEINQNQRSAIIASIVASLLVLYFIDPILTFLSKLFLNIADILFSSYLDRLYAEISSGDPNIGLIFIYLFFGAPTILCIYILTKKILSLIRKNDLDALTEKGDKKIIVKKIKKLSFYLTINLIILSILGLFIIVDHYVRFKTSSSFHQYMTVIHPSISDKEYKELLAQYASMRTKADYDELIRKILNISKNSGVELPENKLYPF